jgi:hypothetical protein
MVVTNRNVIMLIIILTDKTLPNPLPYTSNSPRRLSWSGLPIFRSDGTPSSLRHPPDLANSVNPIVYPIRATAHPARTNFELATSERERAACRG